MQKRSCVETTSFEDVSSGREQREVKRIQSEFPYRKCLSVSCSVNMAASMEISQLRALLALKESASLTIAAKRIEQSTSATFCQIQQLEQEIGKKLYQQIGKQLRLTDAGELVLKDAVQIIEMHDAAVSSVKEAGGMNRRLVRVGCGPHSSVTIAPYLLRALRTVHPNTDVRLITSDDEVLMHDLRIGVLDVLLLSLPASGEEFIEEPLWSYEIVLVTPPGIQWNRKSTELLNSSKLPFILYRRATVTDLPFQQFCQDFGVKPKIVIENNQLDSIKRLVSLGLGISVLPEWSVMDEGRRGLIGVSHLKNRYLRNYGVAFRRSGYRPQALDDLLAVSRKWREWWPLEEYAHDPI
jgi:DNA-binding transcriptional LysR family regulator